jgi:septum formation protein
VRGLILASASPRRRELLGGLGLRFETRSADVDETPHPGEEAEAYVVRLAREKAAAVARPGELVLAADTTVVVDGEILGKPLDAEDARRMLRQLAGREHEVLTGIALAEPNDGDEGRIAARADLSRVRMAPLTDEEIDWYVATGEPMDKAGAYGIQGLGSLFVEAVDGNYTNVVGLPIPAVYKLFAELGYDLKSFRLPPRT